LWFAEKVRQAGRGGRLADLHEHVLTV
jgi:hypothetical protein